MRLTALVVVACAVLVWSSPGAHAGPALYGGTGVIVTPNTEVTPKDTVEVGGQFIISHMFSLGGNWPVPKPTLYTASINIGVLDRLEISPTFLHLHKAHVFTVDGGSIFDSGDVADTNDDEFLLGLKYQLFREPQDKFGLAVGILDATGNVWGQIPYYGVISKKFWSPSPRRWARLNFGVVVTEGNVFFSENKEGVIPPPSDPTIFPALGSSGIFDAFAGRRKDDRIQEFISFEIQPNKHVQGNFEGSASSFSYGMRFNPLSDLWLNIDKVMVFGQYEKLLGISYRIQY